MGADKIQAQTVVATSETGENTGQTRFAEIATQAADPREVALVQAQMLEEVALALAEQIVEENAPGSGQGEPRIMRLLKKLDPSMHTQLAKELSAVLNLLKSPTIAEPLKIKLRGQIRKIIEARLGPAFKQIAVAEGFLSDPPSHFAAAAAGILEIPELYKIPEFRDMTLHSPAIPEASVKPVFEAARLLNALKEEAKLAFERCKGSITQYAAAGFYAHTGSQKLHETVNQFNFLASNDQDLNRDQDKLINFLEEESKRLGILLDLKKEDYNQQKYYRDIELFRNGFISNRYTPPAPKSPANAQAQAQALTPLAALLAEGVRKEKLESGKDSRTFRLLKILDPKLYDELKKELADLLTLLKTPTFDDAIKQALQDQMDQTIEQKLGPGFQSIRLAEFVLSDHEANLPSLAAAVEQVETPVHDDQTVVETYHTAHALQELQKAVEAVNMRLLKAVQIYLREQDPMLSGFDYGSGNMTVGDNTKRDALEKSIENVGKKLGINFRVGWSQYNEMEILF